MVQEKKKQGNLVRHNFSNMLPEKRSHSLSVQKRWASLWLFAARWEVIEYMQPEWGFCLKWDMSFFIPQWGHIFSNNIQGS